MTKKRFTLNATVSQCVLTCIDEVAAANMDTYSAFVESIGFKYSAWPVCKLNGLYVTALVRSKNSQGSTVELDGLLTESDVVNCIKFLSPYVDVELPATASHGTVLRNIHDLINIVGETYDSVSEKYFIHDEILTYLHSGVFRGRLRARTAVTIGGSLANLYIEHRGRDYLLAKCAHGDLINLRTAINLVLGEL